VAARASPRALNYRAWMRALGALVALELVALLAGIGLGGWRWSWPPDRDGDWILTLSILIAATVYAWLRTMSRYLRQSRHNRPTQKL